MKEKVLLLMTSFYNYYKEIINSLSVNGYETIWFDDKVNLNSVEKILNKVNGNVFREKISKYFYEKINSIKNEKISKIIIVFGVSIQKEHIKYLREVFLNVPIVYYAWDSVANFANIEFLIKECDYSYSFDPYDSQKYGATFLPLFYSDNDTKNNKVIYDVSTVMSLYQEKINDLKIILNQISSFKNVNINLIVRSKLSFLKLFVNNVNFFIKYKKFIRLRPLTLEQTNYIVNASRVIVDCPIQNQNGLTIRTFETLSKRKKIITTNKDIINYDFYTEKNICIVGKNKITNDFVLSDFDTNYSLSEKYNIDNFIKKIISEE